MKPGKLRAEEQFAKLQKQTRIALKEKELVQTAKSARMAHLRGLRLARDASDKVAADSAAADKASAKLKKISRKP